MSDKSLFKSQEDIENLHQSSIAIADGTPANIQSLKKILSGAGFSVSVANSYTEQKTLPDLILLDISMSGLDGFKTCQRLKVNPHTEKIPVIFLLAADGAIDKSQIFSVGGADYIAAPFQADEILARVKNQLALRATKEKTRELGTVLENAMEGISRLDSQGRYISVNKAYASMVGYKPDEMIGMDWSITVHPEDLEKAVAAYQQTIADGKSEIEIRGVCKDGSIFYKQATLIKIYDKQERFVGHYCFAKDITQRKQREAVLHNITLGLSAATGENIFQSLVKYLSQALAMDFAFIGELIGSKRDRVRIIAVYGDGQAIENFDYDLAHTPCEKVVGQNLCIYPQNVRQEFPLDPHLQEMGMESYVGIALFDSNGRHIGLIAVLSRKRLQSTELMEEILKTFAVRVTSEIERRQLELSLQASEAKLSNIINSAIAAITSIRIFGDRTNWEYNYCSAGCEKVYGYTAQEIMSDKNLWYSRVLPEDINAVILPALDRYWREETVSLEYRFVRKDGRIVWIASTSTSCWDESANCWVITAVETDISDRKIAEDSLRESEERWQLAIQGNKDGIWDRNLLSDRHYLSPRCLEMLGYQLSDIDRFEKWSSYIHPDDIARMQIAFQQHLERQTPHYSCEYRIRCSDGNYKWILSRGQALWDERGIPIRVVGSITDISERKAAEAVLRQYERMVSATPDVMALVDRNYTYRQVNQACLAWNRVGWDAAIGHTMGEILGEEVFRNIVKPNFDRCLAGETIRFETWIDYPGERRFVGVTYAPYIETNGAIAGVVINCRNLTNLKQTEGSLRQNEALFRSLFEQVAVGIAFTDCQCNLLRLNQKFCEILGYSEEELRSLTFRELTHPDDLEISVIYNQQLENGERSHFNLEKRYIRKDGSTVWSNTSVSIIRDVSGSSEFYAIILQDITERKRTQQELQRQNQRSQLIAEIALNIRQSLQVEEILATTASEVQKLLKTDRALIFRLDSLGIMHVVKESANPQWVSLIGQEIDHTCFGWDCLHQYHQGQPYSIVDIEKIDIEDCLASFLQEFQVKSMLVIPVLLHEKLWGLLVIQQCSDTRQWTAYEIDLLEQVANQVGIALSQSQREAQFRSLIENASDLITLLDEEGIIRYVSPSVDRVLDYDPDWLVGQNLSNFLHAEDRDKAARMFTNALKTSKTAIPVEMRWREKKGGWRVFEAIAKQFQDSIGFTGAIVSFRDITERLKLEEMQRALERERELSELKLRFFSMASHELRTPLSVILLATEILEHSEPEWLDAKKLRNIHRIQDTVENLTQMLANVLTIARAEAQKLEFNPAPFSLSQLCNRCLQGMQASLDSHYSIRFTYTGENREVCLDEKLLHSILTNLLANAIKYSPSNSQIDFDVTLQEEAALFVVKDRGIGIPLENRAKLFEAFYRGDNVGKIEGSGLGLAVVKRCVDLHGGRITCDSVLGEGTTFIVWLPIFERQMTVK